MRQMHGHRPWGRLARNDVAQMSVTHGSMETEGACCAQGPMDVTNTIKNGAKAKPLAHTHRVHGGEESGSH